MVLRADAARCRYLHLSRAIDLKIAYASKLSMTREAEIGDAALSAVQTVSYRARRLIDR